MRNTLQYILKKLLFMIPMVLFITFLIYGIVSDPGRCDLLYVLAGSAGKH